MASNGRLPANQISRTVIGVSVRNDLAKQTNQLAYAFYLRFGYALRATDGYRTYATQVILKAQKGAYAATPGTSNHGWGTAIDFASNINSFQSAEHKWMRANGSKFGWHHPTWAHDGNPANGMDEPWHFEAAKKNVSAPYVGMPAKGTVGFGQKGAAVREVQTLLRSAGYTELKVDSDFGMATGVRVVSFQGKHNLVQDGVVGKATLAVLKGGKAPAKPSKPAPPKHAQPKPGTPAFIKGRVQRVQGAVHAVKDGVWGPDTAKRVAALKTASAYWGSRHPFGVRFTQSVVGVAQDGVWGPKSAAAHDKAVARIQAVLGITSDGLWGKQTSAAVNALESKAKKK